VYGTASICSNGAQLKEGNSFFSPSTLSLGASEIRQSMLAAPPAGRAATGERVLAVLATLMAACGVDVVGATVSRRHARQVPGWWG
jgi:hypothetical protein